mmetsp:Transcript_45235/g.110210  ORF Transcript_45235/g.110210 Transcript_45235/m.110210 type:complete len:122 (+) Transcript_45235:163-528(+)
MISNTRLNVRMILLGIFCLWTTSKAFVVQPTTSIPNRLSVETQTPIPSTTAIFSKRKKLAKSLKNIFKKPKTTANFDMGKRVKLSSARAEELAKKYETMDSVEDKAFNVLIDLDIVQPTKS